MAVALLIVSIALISLFQLLTSDNALWYKIIMIPVGAIGGLIAFGFIVLVMIVIAQVALFLMAVLAFASFVSIIFSLFQLQLPNDEAILLLIFLALISIPIMIVDIIKGNLNIDDRFDFLE